MSTQPFKAHPTVRWESSVLVDENDQRLTRKEAAKYLGLTLGTLSVWASTGRYFIPYYRIGREVHYLKSDLDSFIKRRKKTIPKSASVNWQSSYQHKCKELAKCKKELRETQRKLEEYINKST